MASIKHILIIEDDEHMLNQLVSMADGLGLRVDTATNIVDAVQRLERGAYDLVLSDNNFPRYRDERHPTANQGFEVLRWMRSEEKYEKVPFILHTSDDSPDTPAKVKEHGGIFHQKHAAGLKEALQQALLAEHAQ